MIVYKILTSNQWEELKVRGESFGSEVDMIDGYIHFSSPEQVRETAAKHFAGLKGLWLLGYHAQSLDRLKWEPSRGGDLFPHLYDVLPLQGIVEAVELPWDGEAHVFPPSVPENA